MSYTQKHKNHTVTHYTQADYLELQQQYPIEKLATPNSVIDPVTNEINWECPCLGGMAQPPCGPYFKKAFQCFNDSTAELKGSDCVDKFQQLTKCFRKYPKLYRDELKDEGPEDEQINKT